MLCKHLVAVWYSWLTHHQYLQLLTLWDIFLQLHIVLINQRKRGDCVLCLRVLASAFIRGFYIRFIYPLMISYYDIIKEYSLFD